MSAIPVRLQSRVEQFRRRRLYRRQRRAIETSSLFDVAWYRAAYGLAPDDDAIDHYLAGPEDRRPSPWFDAAWYLRRYPDMRGGLIKPLTHYILFGARENRDPNPTFVTRWYRDSQPEAAAWRTPLDHYVSRGAARRADPAPDFDAEWYAATYLGGEGPALDPLAHFLLVGRAAGARVQPRQVASAGRPVEAARLETFKALAPARGRVVALLAARAAAGRLAPATLALVEQLAAAGACVALAVESDTAFAPDAELLDRLGGGWVRAPDGDASATWAHLLRAESLLFSGALLLLLRESAAELVAAAPAPVLLERLLASRADVAIPDITMTRPRRFDSRLIGLKGRALAYNTLHNFFGGLTVGDEAEDAAALQADFETSFTATIEAAAFTTERLLSPTAAPHAAGSAPATALATLRPTPCVAQPLKIAFIGPWNYATGLSQASRGYISALWRTGARLNIHPIETVFHTHARVAPTITARDFEGSADAVIVHLNPDGWGALSAAQQTAIERARIRIGLWVWEMGHMPPAWREAYATVDEIWTPSHYCAEVFRGEGDKPVRVVPHVVAAPPASHAAARDAVRAQLGLTPRERFVLYAFDGASYLVRKNPDALVRAFAAAGLATQGWRLVLKTKNLLDQPKDGAALAQLVAETEGAQILESQLSSEALAALFDAADIYASSHRSEGFGLTVAEAMAVGKPVVATDYGGVQDFLDASCGYPVPARTVRLEQDFGVYARGGTWGEVDEAAFARALQAAAAEVDAGRDDIGLRARARIAERLSAAAVAGAMRQALAQALSAGQKDAA